MKASELLPRHTEGQLWLSPALEINFNKRWNMEVYEQLRLDQQMNHFKSAISGLEFSYGRKWYKLGGGYNYFLEQGDYRHRVLGFFTSEYTNGDFSLSNRLRMDVNYYRFDGFASVFRDEISLAYQFNKHWKMAAFSELFYENSYSFHDFYRLRSGLGMNYSLNKRNSFKLKSFYQYEFNQAQPTDAVVVSLGYSYSLNIKKKKNKLPLSS